MLPRESVDFWPWAVSEADTQGISHSAEVTSEQCACLQEKSCGVEKPIFSFPCNVKSPQWVSLSEQDTPQILIYQRIKMMTYYNNNRIQYSIICISFLLLHNNLLQTQRLQKAGISMPARLHSHRMFDWRRFCLQDSSGCWQNLSLWGCRTEVLLSSWLLTGGRSEVLEAASSFLSCVSFNRQFTT